jgi:hypothetical protein
MAHVRRWAPSHDVRWRRPRPQTHRDGARKITRGTDDEIRTHQARLDALLRQIHKYIDFIGEGQGTRELASGCAKRRPRRTRNAR